MSAVRPSLQTLLPTPELVDAFESKTAAYEAARLVRDLRRAANLTQKELADRLDVSQARVSMIERGDGTDGPTFGLLKRIVLACDFVWSPSFAVKNAVAQAGPAMAEAETGSAVDEVSDVQARRVYLSRGD